MGISEIADIIIRRIKDEPAGNKDIINCDVHIVCLELKALKQINEELRNELTKIKARNSEIALQLGEEG